MNQEMTEMSFGKMKTVLARELSSSDCESLCVYFDINKATTDKIKQASWPGLQLLNELTDNEVILEDDLTKLQTALNDLHLGKAANIAVTYQRRCGK